MDPILIELFKITLLLLSGCFSITLLFIAWKVFRCPDSLWKEMQRTPYHKSYTVMERFWHG